MRTEEIVEVRTAVAVTEEALRLLCKRIEDFAAAVDLNATTGRPSKVLYHGELVGGNKFSFGTAEELLAYQNRYDRRIITLIVSLSIGFNERQFSIIVSEKAGGYAFKGTAAGEVGEALQNKQYLEDFAASIRAPWRWMWWHAGDILFGLFFAFLLFVFAVVPFFLPDNPTPAPTQASHRAGAWLTIYFVGAIASIFAMYQVRKHVFPRAIIALGQGKARFETLKRWHWVPVTATAGLVVKIIWDLIGVLK